MTHDELDALMVPTTVVTESTTAEAAPLAISFIIPTLNEERFVVDCVKQFSQLAGHISHEVIVADGDSTDRTVELAEQAGAKCYVDRTENKTIASGRNLGARFARGELLIFCDADTKLEDLNAFISRVLAVFRDQRVVAAMPRLKVFPEERRWQDRVFSRFLHTVLKTCLFFGCPFSNGQCQVVRKTSFEEVEGYDEKRVHAEDSALFQKLHRIGKIRVLSDQVVLESPRRYRKVGYLNLIRICLVSLIGHAIFKRNVLERWERVD